MVGRELMMVKVVQLGLVPMPHIHHADFWIGELGLGGFSAHDGCGPFGEQDAAGEKLVFVRSAGMGEYRVVGQHYGEKLGRIVSTATPERVSRAD
jgi:hypothetical protein